MIKGKRPKKTDNGNFDSKVALRRHLLEAYHKDTKPSVLDCCAGQQKIWKALRKDFEIEYLGLDMKKIPGTLNADSLKFLQRGNGARFDVIDIDTYGSPFRHLAAALKFIRKPTTIFLTFGDKGPGGPQVETIKALGIDFEVPVTFRRWLAAEHIGEILAGMLDKFEVEYAAESERSAFGGGVPTRYLGLRINQR
jgi:hypothetical protein